MNIDDATFPLLVCALALCWIVPAGFLVVLIMTRWISASSWRRSLVAYRLYFPRGVVDVLFATAAQFVDTPPICHTLYVTYPVERLQLRMLGSWMPVHGLVVLYARNLSYNPHS